MQFASETHVELAPAVSAQVIREVGTMRTTQSCETVTSRRLRHVRRSRVRVRAMVNSACCRLVLTCLYVGQLALAPGFFYMPS